MKLANLPFPIFVVLSGDTATPTATTGDVRGTYAPNAAPNGAIEFEAVVLMQSTAYTGQAQFAG
jgi:hypothetical protein